MAGFALQGFARTSASNNSDFTVNYATGAGTAEGANNIFTYYSSTDLNATIVAADYFLPVVQSLQLYDLIIAVDSTGVSEMLQVTTIVYPNDAQATYVPTVVVSAFAATGTVGTGNIQALAVTTAKIDNLAVTTGKIALAAVTSATVSPLLIQYASVAITAAQFNGMYAAPKALIAAGGANTLLKLHSFVLEATYVAAQYASGGAVAVQYDATVHGAGPLASAALAAADINGITADSVIGASGGSLAVATKAATVNKGLYLSNLTGAFTTGDSTWVAHIWYSIVPA